MFRIQKAFLVIGVAAVFTACKKDKDPIIVIPPSEGAQLQLDGGAGGLNAANSVFVDLSADKATSVARNSWDLAFYSGSQFRVKINNTNGASAVAVNKTDINTVSLSDIDVDTLKIPLGDEAAFSVIDDPITTDITKTVIAEVSATEASNKVYIINPAGGSHTAPFEPANFWKVRILRKSGGYTLQYAKVNETTFKTLEITKDADYNFQFVSLTTGSLVNVEPAKNSWDFQWTWSMYYMSGATPVPYSFSDLVFINKLAGVTAGVVLNSTVTYDAYSKSNIATTTFTNDYNVIGHKWRVTSPSAEFPGAPVGVLTDRFFVVKDAAGNVYKLRFLNFHANDGGERGKPKFEYKLVQ